ncbi:5250_t:CDS:2, partial [Racocetra persica]
KKKPMMQTIVDRSANNGYSHYARPKMNGGGTYGYKYDEGGFHGVNGGNGQRPSDNRDHQRGSFNGRSGNGRNGNGVHVPSNYRIHEELVFRVTNIQSEATATDLKDHFNLFGSVYKVVIETAEYNGADRSIGAALVTFRPPPPPFWNRDVVFHGRVLKLEHYPLKHNNTHFKDPADGKHKLKKHTFNAESIEMGAFLQPDTFVSEALFTEKVNFMLDYKRRIIKVIFVVQRTHTFKLEIQFKDVDGEIIAECDRYRAILTVSSKFPARYWFHNGAQRNNKNQRNNNAKLQDFNWCYDDCWKRKTEIRVVPRTDEEKSLPLQLNMPNKSDKIGKWLVFRITFDLDSIKNGIKEIKDMLIKAGEYNLASKPGEFRNRPIKVVKSDTLEQYWDRSTLQFDVAYMIESNISHNFLNEYNLSEDFYKILSQQSSGIALRILETISARKKRFFDPLTTLRSEILKLSNVDVKAKYVPSYCVMMRKVVVTPTTMYILPPSMETSNRVIRHFQNCKENFLRVQFTDEASGKVGANSGNDALYNRIYQTLVSGIKIGDRHYEFLAFSSSQLRDHSCWFFAPTDKLTADDIRNWMGDFSENCVVAKYAARMGQCFSSTRAIAYLQVDDIVEIPDIYRGKYNFSDGTGKISYGLAKTIAQSLELKNTPCAFQFRLAGYKGVLCLSRYLHGNKIQVRPSQCKFESTHQVLEVIRGSCMITAFLNRQAITLLSTLGVPDEVFIDMKNQQVQELDKMLKSDHMAMSVLLKNADEHGMTRIMSDLVKADFLQRKDPFILNLLALFRIMMLRDLKRKAKIRVDDGAFLLGVLDETNSLKDNQIYCCKSDPQNPNVRQVIKGTCIVYRNPCFHPGDIRVVTAVECKNLDYLVDVVVFPAQGFRDIPSQCSGGDLDGDDFTIIYDPRLIPKIKNFEPMNYEAPKPEMVEQVTIDHVKKFFVNYICTDQLGSIANAHLAKADMAENGAFHGQCMRLAQLHSEAVDFPKTGSPLEFPNELRVKRFPDFMEKPDKPSYPSPKVLGRLYRSIEVSDFSPYTEIVFDDRLLVPGIEAYLEDARECKRDYDSEVRGLMNQYGILSEYEVASGFIVNTVLKIEKKKPRDIQKSVSDMVAVIKRLYKRRFEKEFYIEGADGANIISPESRGLMEAKASAWYYVTYHKDEIGDDPSDQMISFPWVNHEILCQIAMRSSGKKRAFNDLYVQDKKTYQASSSASSSSSSSSFSSLTSTNSTSSSFNNYNTQTNDLSFNSFDYDYLESQSDGMDRLISKKIFDYKSIKYAERIVDIVNKSDKIGKWLVFRITFDLDSIKNGIKEIKDMLIKAGEYNLASKPGEFRNRPIKVVKSDTLEQYWDRSTLQFDVAYMIESNISHNFLNEYNLSEDFYKILSQQSSGIALRILETISARKKRFFDPLTTLRSEILKLSNVDVKAKYVPSYCVMMRKVVVTPTTMYILPPSMETSNRVIRHFQNCKENFLRVQFTDEASGKVGANSGNDALYNRIYQTLVSGIKIGDRHYEFLAFSSSQLRDHSCWFFAPTDKLTADDIRNWMGDFSENCVVAKYAARMGQCFSSTRAIAYLQVDDIVEIPDIYRGKYNFSDGTGKISYGLAKTIAQSLELKNTPCAFQFRLAGYKGVLCLSRYLHGNKIQVRPSQCKFESTHQVLEVIRGSCMITAFLNRQAITLLSTLGVPDEVFIDMKNQQVQELDKMLKSDHMAMSVLLKNADEHGMTRIMSDLVKADFLQRKDPFILNLLALFRIMMLRDLKRKAKIRVDDGAFLLGVLDETNSLKDNQIYCCKSDPQNPNVRQVIKGTCIVYRNPCFHPGDIRVVTAVECKNLDYLVDVVVFPAQGFRDIPSQCSGGDLDGDDFTIIYDPRLIPKIKNFEPMNYEAPKPEMVEQVTIDHVKKFFVNYICTDQLGSIANAHLAKADMAENGAFHGQCMRLAQLHSEAVDFPKTGSPLEFPNELRVKRFPDFMEKPDKPSYPSPKVLGRLYRSIEVSDFSPYTEIVFDDRLLVPGIEAYLEDARECKRDYDSEVRGLMNQYGILSEYEVASGFIVNTVLKIEKKKPRDIQKSVSDMVAVIKRLYKRRFEKEFYIEGADGANIISPESRGLMEAKASAWYYVTYHKDEIGDDPSDQMISFPWVNHEILCQIAMRSSGKKRAFNDLYVQDKKTYQASSSASSSSSSSSFSSLTSTNSTSSSFNNYNTQTNDLSFNSFDYDYLESQSDGMDRLISKKIFDYKSIKYAERIVDIVNNSEKNERE